MERFDNGLPTGCIMSDFAKLGGRWRAAKVLNSKRQTGIPPILKRPYLQIKTSTFSRAGPITSRFWIRLGYIAIVFRFRRILPGILSSLNTICRPSPVSLSHITSSFLAASSAFARSTADETFGRPQSPAN